MSEKPKMDAPGTLYPRGSRYSWKIKVPADLAHLPSYRKADGSPKQNAADVSLGTADRAEAQAKAVALAAEWARRFAAERRALEVQSPQELSPAIVDAIAQRVRGAVLADDERVRASPLALAEWLLPWWRAQEIARRAVHEREHPERRYVPRTMPDELTAEGMAELKVRPTYLGTPAALFALLVERHQQAAKSARQAMALGGFAPFVMLADREAKALGVNLGPDGWLPDSGPLAPVHEACKRAYLNALDDLAQRDAGTVVDTPPIPREVPERVSTTKPATHTLRDVFDKWKAGGDNPSPSTVRKKEYAVRLFEAHTDNAAIESLTPEQGAVFAGWLLEECKAEKTAKDHMEAVKSLLNKATKQGGLGWLTENPWVGHRVRVKQKASRKPWKPDALARLFKSPLFNAYALPTLPSAGRAAAYWVPLLGIYTGARQSELCQLRVSDVEAIDGGLCLYITAERADDDAGTEETSTKAEVSRRRIPVHPELIGLGFEDYWRDTQDAGFGALFPDVQRVAGRGAGEYFSDWFLIYRREQGISTRWVDFHAFRHTASTRLTDAGVPDAISDYLTGHSSGSRGSGRGYKHVLDMPSLRDHQAKLKYPELGLKRVYPVRLETSKRPTM